MNNLTEDEGIGFIIASFIIRVVCYSIPVTIVLWGLWAMLKIVPPAVIVTAVILTVLAVGASLWGEFVTRAKK